jgi:hypothetical protein
MAIRLALASSRNVSINFVSSLDRVFSCCFLISNDNSFGGFLVSVSFVDVGFTIFLGNTVNQNSINLFCSQNGWHAQINNLPDLVGADSSRSFVVVSPFFVLSGNSINTHLINIFCS